MCIRDRPDFILGSAGFDAHAEDLLAELRLIDDGDTWITELIAGLADQYAQGRVVNFHIIDLLWFRRLVCVLMSGLPICTGYDTLTPQTTNHWNAAWQQRFPLFTNMTLNTANWSKLRR